MDGPLYPNQPLVEVATEVRFKADLAVETARQKFHSTIRDRYPSLYLPHAKVGVAPSLQPYRFESEDRKFGIQVAVNTFSFYSREYPGHVVFIDELEDVLSSFMELFDSMRATRIGWRYINAIPFARENEELPLKRFFNENSFFGSSLVNPLVSLSCKVLAPKDTGFVLVSLESSQTEQEPHEEALLLDIDAFKKFESPQALSTKDLLKQIVGMHNLAYGVFENMITDGYRAYLKGGKNE